MFVKKKYLMRYSIFLILFLFLSKLSFSIDISHKDSLEALLMTVNERDRMEISIELADIYMSISLEQSREYVLSSFQLAKKYNDTAFIAVCYRQLGAIKMMKEENDSAMIYFYKSLELSNKINDKNSIATTKANISTVFFQQGEYDKSLELCYEALNDFIKLNDVREQAVLYNNIGKIYQKKKEYKKAISFFLKSIELKDKKKDELSIAYTYSNIGQTYSCIGESELAVRYLLEALDVLNYYEDEYSIAVTSAYLGEHYLSVNDYEKSDIYLQQSVNISISNGYNIILKNNYFLLSELHELNNNYKQALKYYKLFESTKDIIYVDNKQRLLIEYQTKYETYEQNEEIERLNEDNFMKEEKLITRTFLLKVFIAAFIFVCLLILIIVFQKNKLSKAYNHLVQQNLDIANTDDELRKLKYKIEGQTTISKQTETELYDELIDLFENKKIFTDQDLTLYTLAEELNTNTSYLSRIINDKFNKNFNNFINLYRINEARKLLMNPDNHSYTIASIAKDVGFRSISVFNKAFKENTGLTPSYFLKSMRK